MEPADKSANNSADNNHEVLDDHLEKIAQDFNEFARTKSANCSDADAKTLDDLIDMYIASGGASLPIEFNESQSLLPQNQAQSAPEQSTDSLNIDIDFELTDEMTEYTSQNGTGNFPDCSPTVNTNFHVGVEGGNSSVTHVRYGDLKFLGVAGPHAEIVFDSVMKSFKTPGAGRKKLRQKLHVKKNGEGTGSRKYVKRRYQQIMENNEKIAHQKEITNVKNREAGAKAHAKKTGCEEKNAEPLRRSSQIQTKSLIHEHF